MALAFDPATDFEDIVDGSESVTVAALDTSTTTVATALRRSIARSSDETELATRRATTWHLPAAEHTDEPEIGGTITDGDGTVWEIEGVFTETFGNRWRCECGAEVVTAVLDTIVTIEKAAITKGPHGAAVRTWATWKMDVRAAIKPADVSMDIDGDARVDRATHDVTLASDLALTSQHRIVSLDGTIYHILSHQGREAVGTLQTLRCTVTPFPLR